MDDHLLLTAAECASGARAYEECGYYEKAASLWRDAAELAWTEEARLHFMVKAQGCEGKAKGQSSVEGIQNGESRNYV